MTPYRGGKMMTMSPSLTIVEKPINLTDSEDGSKEFFNENVYKY